MRSPISLLGSWRVGILLSGILVAGLVIPARLNPWVPVPHPQEGRRLAGSRRFDPDAEIRQRQNLGRLQEAERERKPKQVPAIDELRRAKLEEAKRDAATLAGLAESLKSRLADSDPNTLSVETVKDAEKIEKLAKKIKNWAKSS